MLNLSPLLNISTLAQDKVSPILKIKSSNTASPSKWKKRSVVNFPPTGNDFTMTINEVVKEEIADNRLKVPRIAELLYKVVVLIRIKNLIRSRTSMKKPLITKEDRLVYANDLAYNSQKMEKDIFQKKYLEKNVTFSIL